MKCTKRKCLECKHSIVGDKCNKDDVEFELASSRDFLDRIKVYEVKINYLNYILSTPSNIKKEAKEQRIRIRKNIENTNKILMALIKSYKVNHKKIYNKQEKKI